MSSTLNSLLRLLDSEQQKYVRKHYISEGIHEITFHPKSLPYAEDNIWEFKKKNGERPFSVLQNPNGEFHIWRPL